jgi:hypothetical protein
MWLASLLVSAGAWAGLDAPAPEPLLPVPWAPPGLFLRPQLSLLPSSAFAALPPCGLDPFADASTDERALQFERPCGQDQLRLRVNSARPVVEAGAVRYEFEVDQLLTQHLGDELTTTARLNWLGAGEEQSNGTQTSARALFAAGAQYRLDPDWSLQLNVGREATPTDPRTRATMSGAWRPAGEHLLYMQWAAEPEGVANTVGMRWWLVPRRMAVDVTARVPPDGQAVEPRLGLSLLEWAR